MKITLRILFVLLAACMLGAAAFLQFVYWTFYNPFAA